MQGFREVARKYFLMCLFQKDINNMYLEDLHKLYNAAHVTNKRLLEQLHKHNAALTDLNKAVYMDIAYIPIDEVIDNSEIEEFFSSLYDNRYPEIKKYIDFVEKRAEAGFDSGFEAYRECIKKLLPTHNIDHLKNVEFNLFQYYIYSNDSIFKKHIYLEENF